MSAVEVSKQDRTERIRCRLAELKVSEKEYIQAMCRRKDCERAVAEEVLTAVMLEEREHDDVEKIDLVQWARSKPVVEVLFFNTRIAVSRFCDSSCDLRIQEIKSITG
ncbi:hypothetical protein [Rubinisphaera italica]|uniref:Uncharacterized protein n=1 Tax=Rubinisphaera italica TaxID=2527969 RepID=A0A5C5XKU4_9PLAN|nr:hypothetical protein [Rubinisphaera italica]TWT63159.1 hypothetical protein Pan54_39120 [Rubinisphaera italica]